MTGIRCCVVSYWFPLPVLFAGAMLGIFAACAAGQAPVKPGMRVEIPKKLEGGSQLAVRRSAFVDMRFLVRAVNTGRATAPAIEGFDRALAADKAAMESLPGLASGVFEADFLTCPDAAEAKRRAATLDERASFPGLKLVNLRKLGTDLAEALAAIEPAYLAQVWPAHENVLAEAGKGLEATVVAKQRECISDLLAGLAMTDPGVEIGVYLITSGPAPGSYTFRVGNGMACVIAVGRGADDALLVGDDLAETVLYQSIYALNTGVPSPKSVPTVLRKNLKERSLPSGDCGNRELFRAVFYAQAAATVRRVLDPNHAFAAESRGLFKDCPTAWEAAKGTWERVGRGELSPDAAVVAAIDAYVGNPNHEPVPEAAPK